MTEIDKRYVDLEGTFNFRDIGGYSSNDGRHVKYGVHYRADELSKLTPADVTNLHDIGIKTIIDYRGDRERVNNEDVEIPGASIYYLDPVADIAALASSEFGEEMSDEHSMLKISAELAERLMTDQNIDFVESERSIKAFRTMFDLILSQEEGAIVQHCRGGKDRTGYGVALILLLLGVSKDDVMHDYMLTNHYKKDKNETSLKALLDETGDEDMVRAVRFFKEAQPSFLLKGLDLIESKYGGILPYAKNILGLTDEEIETIKNKYLEII